MKMNVTESMFIYAFKGSGTYKNKFSYKGLQALFEYFENLENEVEEDVDFDMIAICCEYTEYKNFDEFKENYSARPEFKTIEDLQEFTWVIMIEGEEGFIIQDF